MGSPSGCGADNRAGPFIIATPQGVRWLEDAFDEIQALLKGNPETSISRACVKYIKHIYCNEAVVFFALIYRYWYEHDDMVGWHDIDDYFDGDVGGIKKKDAKISASRKLDAVSINRKELFYNSAEGYQVAQLKELLSDKSFNGIRARMKDKGLRSGFTCLFYGSPGTGKTETVYQAELNKFKAEVDEKVAEANKSISSDSLLNMKLWVDARRWKGISMMKS